MTSTQISLLTDAAYSENRQEFDRLTHELYVAASRKNYTALSGVPHDLIPEAHPPAFGVTFQLGLTVQQVTAVSNLKERLLSGDKKDLQRALRSKNFDRKQLSDRLRPVDPAKVDRLVAQYRERTRRSQARKQALAAFRLARSLGDYRGALFAYIHHGLSIQKRWESDGERHNQFADQGWVDIYHNYGTGSEIVRFPRDPSAAPANVVSCSCKMSYKVV